jgi:hypothetical protein
MKLYFLPSSVPELAALPRKERNRVWLHARRSAAKKETSIWLAIAMCGILAGVGEHIGMLFAIHYIGGAIGAALGWFLVQLVLIHATLPYVREALMKTEPNQALEPTSTAVTPPASAGDRASGTRGSP